LSVQLRRVGEFAVHHADGYGRDCQRPIGGHRDDLGQHRVRLQVRSQPGHRQLLGHDVGHGRLDRQQQLFVGSLTWPVTTVAVTVGQTVKKGDTLAVADSTAAQLQLTSSQATLASAQSKLTTDSGGPTALTKAQAANQLNQAKNSYSQAVANRKITGQQNSLTLSSPSGCHGASRIQRGHILAGVVQALYASVRREAARTGSGSGSSAGR